MSEKRLKASVVIGGLIDRSFQTVLTDSKKGFRQIGDAVKALKKDQVSLNTEIENTKGKGLALEQLRGRYTALGEAIRGAQTEARKLRSAEAFKGRMDRGNEQARFMAGRSAMGAVAGGAFLHNVLKESSLYQTENARLKVMGVPDTAKKEAFEAGRALKTFGTTIRENTEMVNDGLAVFGKISEARMAAPLMAKMKFANSTLFGTSEEEAERQQKDMLRVIDLRGGASNEEEFKKQSNYIQQALNASKGMVNGSEFFKLISHGGTAVKGMNNEALYYKLIPLIQEMKGETLGTSMQMAYNGLVQGHTDKRSVHNLDRAGLIGDKSKVKFDKNGSAAQINPGALKGADVFAHDPTEWVRSVMLPSMMKSGVITKSLYDHALSGKLSDTERDKLNMETGKFGNSSTGKLLSTISTSLVQIARDSQNASQSATIDGSVSAAKGTAKGQEMGIHAQLTNARLNLGQAIMPTYISLLQKTNTALEKFNGFITDHPKLTRAMMIGTVAVTGALAVGVPLLFTAGAAMSLYGNITALSARRQALFAVAQTQATRATLMGTEAETAASMARIGGWKRVGGATLTMGKRIKSGTGAVFKSLKRSIGGLIMGARLLGPVGTAIALLQSPFQLLLTVAMGALTGIGSALSVLLSPVGLLVGALAVGALLIWRNWRPISAFFSGFADGVMSALAPMKPLFSSIKAWAAPVVTWLGNLLTPVNSTRESLDQAGSAGKRFGEVLGKGIKSAIDIISELIGKIEWVLGKGAAIGGFLWKGARSLFGGDESSQGHEPLPPVPPVQAASARGGDTHMTNSFHITQQPGQSPQELMQAAKDQMWERHPVKAPLLGDGLIGSAY